MKRNSVIDIMRFLFAILIMLLHSDILGPVDIFPFEGGYIAVDFFFILSGFYAFMYVEKISAEGEVEAPAKETLSYIIHKYVPIYLAVAVSLAFDLIAMCIVAGYSARFFVERFVITIFESLLLHSIVGVDGFRLSSLWFLSALLIALTIVVYLALKYRDLFVHILVYVFPVFIYGFFFKTCGTISRFDYSYFFIINEGVLRAIAGACMGGIAFYMSLKMKKKVWKGIRKVGLTMVEVGGYAGVYFGCMLQSNTIADFMFIMMLMVSVAITASEKSYTGQMRIPASDYLGRISFAMYLVHATINVVIRNVMDQSTYLARLPWYFIVTFACAAVLTAVVDLFKKRRKNKSA